jgi:hypothetical protein
METPDQSREMFRTQKALNERMSDEEKTRGILTCRGALMREITGLTGSVPRQSRAKHQKFDERYLAAESEPLPARAPATEPVAEHGYSGSRIAQGPASGIFHNLSCLTKSGMFSNDADVRSRDTRHGEYPHQINSRRVAVPRDKSQNA